MSRRHIVIVLFPVLHIMIFFSSNDICPEFLESINKGNELKIGMVVDGAEKGCTRTFGDKNGHRYHGNMKNS